MREIVLASASPRRKELLRQLIGDNFKIVPGSYHEKPQPEMPVLDLIIHNSREKAREVASLVSFGIVIAADTVVLCDGEIIGKPHTKDKAREMLRKISGKKIHVVTGLTVIDIDANLQKSTSETTGVRIKIMQDAEIEGYIETSEPLDKAGAFAIQGKGAIIVERIEGDYFNVVGLPLFRLNTILRELGVDVLEMT
ncbi:Maf family nucleotide pyrophosphatase [Methanomethylovorans sp.]|uniref:Maf family nucleotide pyrophosphatase n=1 Tax=Methanomethylovorans sp. TaxID=2758717 RepID=UPI00351C0A77